jgi:hypothetical protein
MLRAALAQVGRCRVYRISSGAAMPTFVMQPRFLAAANAVGIGNVAPDALRVRLHRDERLLL